MRDRIGEWPTRRRLEVSPDRVGDRQERRRASALRRRIAWVAVVALWSAAGNAVADDVSRKQMQGLDEQVQEIKSDALRIAAELDLLEERLLHPSDTQLAVFVALEGGEGFRLDSVQVHLDGEPVAHHIYSFKELEALRKGGVQRIFTGNLSTGEHRLDVAVAGQKPGGGEVAARESLVFRKEIGPELVGITLTGGGAGGADIRVGGW